MPVIVFWNRKVRFRSLRNNALLFAAIFTMLIVAAGPSGMLARFRQPDPYAARREYSEAGLKMILARPLTGFGLGDYATVYPGFAVADDGLHINQAHNDWVQWAAEGDCLFWQSCCGSRYGPCLARCAPVGAQAWPRCFCTAGGLSD